MIESVPIRGDLDVIVARKRVRELSSRAGLSPTAVTELAIAVSELARNVVVHAGSGEIDIGTVFGSPDASGSGARGVFVVVRDQGPGIAEPERAMQDGYSTIESLGFGLASAKRLVDEFELETHVGKGTTITIRKWET